MIPKEFRRLAEVDFPIAVVSQHLGEVDWKDAVRL